MKASWYSFIIGVVLGALTVILIHKAIVTGDFLHVDTPTESQQREWVTHTQLSKALTNVVQSMMLVSQDSRDEAYAWAAEDSQAGDIHLWMEMDYLVRSMEEVFDESSPYNQRMMFEAIEIAEMTMATKLVSDEE